MWIGGDTPIELQRNATVPISAQIIDEISNTPVDLTGYEISCFVASHAGGPVVASPLSVIDDPENGGFSLKFSGSAFALVSGTTERVELAYDVRISDDDGTYVVMRGPLILLPGVGL